MLILKVKNVIKAFQEISKKVTLRKSNCKAFSVLDTKKFNLINRITLENLKAQKLLNKIQRDLIRNGIITNTIVGDLKDLRAYVVEENIPLLAKVIRLTYQHIEENDDFLIAIPEEEPINTEEDGENGTEAEVEISNEEITGKESLEYLLSLMADHSNKLNETELREYVTVLKEEAGEDY